MRLTGSSLTAATRRRRASCCHRGRQRTAGRSSGRQPAAGRYRAGTSAAVAIGWWSSGDAGSQAQPVTITFLQGGEPQEVSTSVTVDVAKVEDRAGFCSNRIRRQGGASPATFTLRLWLENGRRHSGRYVVRSVPSNRPAARRAGAVIVRRPGMAADEHHAQHDLRAVGRGRVIFVGDVAANGGKPRSSRRSSSMVPSRAGSTAYRSRCATPRRTAATQKRWPPAWWLSRHRACRSRYRASFPRRSTWAVPAGAGNRQQRRRHREPDRGDGRLYRRSARTCRSPRLARTRRSTRWSCPGRRTGQRDRDAALPGRFNCSARSCGPTKPKHRPRP